MASEQLIHKWEVSRDSLPPSTPSDVVAYYDRVIDFMRNGEARPMREMFAAKRRELELRSRF